MAATLTAHAANNLPFNNAYTRFVFYSNEFNNCYGQELFETDITKDNYKNIFNWIQEHLKYEFFTDVVNLAQLLEEEQDFNVLCREIQSQDGTTRNTVSVENVEMLIAKLSNFFSTFLNMYYKKYILA
ncbi:MAG: hypothetical protein HEEMFOPI_01729 [Holosporales bacterium]